MRYRVSLGAYAPDLDDWIVDTWEQARSDVLVELAQEGDDCDVCLAQAEEAAMSLRAASGPDWSAEVEGAIFSITGVSDDAGLSVAPEEDQS